jgi:hypothetical protein
MLSPIKLNSSTGARAKVREFESKRISDFRPRLRITFIRLHQNTGDTSAYCIAYSGFSSICSSFTFARASRVRSVLHANTRATQTLARCKHACVRLPSHAKGRSSRLRSEQSRSATAACESVVTSVIRTH